VTVVPQTFEAEVLRGRGEAGRAWLARVPQLLDDACSHWDLGLDGTPTHGGQGLVWPVRRGGSPLVLKITWPDELTRLEAAALEAWQGHGAARLEEHDAEKGLLLLERLEAGRSLEDVPIDEAVIAAAGLIRALAVPAPAGIPTLADEARRMEVDLPAAWRSLSGPFPRRLLDAVLETARTLGPTSATLLVHRDLHYGNVLAGHREPWLAIDPLPVAGDPEFGVARLLMRRFDDGGRAGLRRRLDTIIDIAGLDRDRTEAWTVVHLVDYWLWALGVGLTEDPKLCHTITDWLLAGR
jgi:streptomycin 6-kinase